MKNLYKIGDKIDVIFSMTIKDEEDMPAVVGEVDGYTVVVYHENIADDNRLKKAIIDIIGESKAVEIEEISEEDKIIIGNIRSIELKEREEIIDKLVNGEVVKAKIVKFLSYGAYIEYKNVGGFIKNVDFSPNYISIDDVLEIGDEIEVSLLKLSQTGKLSFKAATPYTVESADISEFHPQDVRVGKVVSTKSFGTFVRLGVNLDCICPPLKSIVVEQGDRVVVEITEVLPEERRVRALIQKVLR